MSSSVSVLFGGIFWLIRVQPRGIAENGNMCRTCPWLSIYCQYTGPKERRLSSSRCSESDAVSATSRSRLEALRFFLLRFRLVKSSLLLDELGRGEVEGGRCDSVLTGGCTGRVELDDAAGGASVVPGGRGSARSACSSGAGSQNVSLGKVPRRITRENIL